VRFVTRQQFATADPRATTPHRGLGYILGTPGDYMGSRLSAFGHGGYGGSAAFADPRYQLAVGLTKNLYSPQGAQGQILHDLRKALGIPQ
jgi:CubicO group peptidase (beta-lactamase class C family)